MIERLSIEQYLPCSLPKIYGCDCKKGISDKDFISLVGDIKIQPMFKGFEIATKQGSFMGDNLSFLLLKKIKENNGIPLELLNEDERLEAERFYYYGLISVNSNQQFNSSSLIIKEVPSEIKYLYQNGKEFSWFSYFPSKIEIDLTNACNFSCIHCSRSSGPLPADDELSIDQIKQVISESAKLGVESIQLMGGEPLIYGNFFEICEYAKYEGIGYLSFSSNGWMISEELAKKISLYFDEIQLSLHGASSRIHDLIVRRKGAFRKLLRAAELLIDNGVKVRLSFTVMEHNQNDIEKMPDIAVKIGASSLRFLSLSPQGRGKKLKQLDKPERESIGRRIKEIYLKEKAFNRGLEIQCGGFPSPKAVDEKAVLYGCPAGRTLLYVAADGSVSCCGVIEEYIGNVKNQSILELWHLPQMVSLREVQKCECNYRYFCSGPCIGDFKNPYSDKIKFRGGEL